MDADRYRSTDRRVVNGSGVSPTQSSLQPEPRLDDSSFSAEEREPNRRASSRDGYRTHDVSGGVSAKDGSKKPNRLGLLLVGSILLLVLLALAAWFVFGQKAQPTGIDNSKYQAVFLSNGQHYFGKLEVMSDEYFKLKDVYYLEQKNQSSEDSNNSTQKTEVELRKLGETEVHGPEDTMIISKQQVILYENLGGNSQVVKYIDQHKQQQ